MAEGTPLLRAQIKYTWSRGFESLLLRQNTKKGFPSGKPFFIGFFARSLYLRGLTNYRELSIAPDFPRFFYNAEKNRKTSNSRS